VLAAGGMSKVGNDVIRICYTPDTRRSCTGSTMNFHSGINEQLCHSLIYHLRILFGGGMAENKESKP
jgi:hypothetical protein